MSPTLRRGETSLIHSQKVYTGRSLVFFPVEIWRKSLLTPQRVYFPGTTFLSNWLDVSYFRHLVFSHVDILKKKTIQCYCACFIHTFSSASIYVQIGKQQLVLSFVEEPVAYQQYCDRKEILTPFNVLSSFICAWSHSFCNCIKKWWSAYQSETKKD